MAKKLSSSSQYMAIEHPCICNYYPCICNKIVIKICFNYIKKKPEEDAEDNDIEGETITK